MDLEILSTITGMKNDEERANLTEKIFREAYYWLRTNTDEDATIMSWWDYGYQISGMANRLVFSFYYQKVHFLTFLWSFLKTIIKERHWLIITRGIIHTLQWSEKQWRPMRMMLIQSCKNLESIMSWSFLVVY